MGNKSNRPAGEQPIATSEAPISLTAPSGACFAQNGSWKPSAVLAVLDCLFHVPCLYECVLGAQIDSSRSNAEINTILELQVIFDMRAKTIKKGRVNISVDQFLETLALSHFDGKTDAIVDNPVRIFQAIFGLIISTLPELKEIFFGGSNKDHVAAGGKAASCSKDCGLNIAVNASQHVVLEDCIHEHKQLHTRLSDSLSPLLTITATFRGGEKDKASSSLVYPFVLSFTKDAGSGGSASVALIYQLQSIVLESTTLKQGSSEEYCSQFKAYYRSGSEFVWNESGLAPIETASTRLEASSLRNAKARVCILVYIRADLPEKLNQSVSMYAKMVASSGDTELQVSIATKTPIPSSSTKSTAKGIHTVVATPAVLPVINSYSHNQLMVAETLVTKSESGSQIDAYSDMECEYVPMEEDSDDDDDYEDLDDEEYDDEEEDEDDDYDYDDYEEESSAVCQCPTCRRERENQARERERSQADTEALERMEREKLRRQLLPKTPGTISVLFRATIIEDAERVYQDGKLTYRDCSLQTITAMEGYLNKSTEELRFEDYCIDNPNMMLIKKRLDAELLDRQKEAITRELMRRDEAAMRAWHEAAKKAWDFYQQGLGLMDKLNDPNELVPTVTWRAIELFTDAIKSCATGPHCVGCHYNRALCNIPRNLMQACTDCEQFVAHDMRNPEGHYLLGSVLLKIGNDPERAEAHFEKALELDPLILKKGSVSKSDTRLEEFEDARAKAAHRRVVNAAEAKKQAGNVALTRGSFTEAEKLYSDAIELVPDGEKSHIYYCNRASARCEIGVKLDATPAEGYETLLSAIDDCNKSLELCPSYTKALFRRHFCSGVASSLKDNLEDALQHFNAALELDPTNAVVKFEVRKASTAIDVIKARERATEIEREMAEREAFRAEEKERERRMLEEKRTRDEQLRKEKAEKVEKDRLERLRIKAEKEQNKVEREKALAEDREREKDRLRIEKEKEKLAREAEREKKRAEKEKEKERQRLEKEEKDRERELARETARIVEEKKALEKLAAKAAVSAASFAVPTSAASHDAEESTVPIVTVSAASSDVTADARDTNESGEGRDVDKSETDKKSVLSITALAKVGAQGPKISPKLSKADDKIDLKKLVSLLSGKPVEKEVSEPIAAPKTAAVAVTTTKNQLTAIIAIAPAATTSSQAAITPPSNKNAVFPPPPSAAPTLTPSPVSQAAAAVAILASSPAVNNGPILTRKSDCPQARVGLVIGAKGSIISEIMKRTGCKVSINQDFPDGYPRKVIYNGTQEKIDAARVLVNTVIDHGPTALTTPELITITAAGMAPQSISTLSYKLAMGTMYSASTDPTRTQQTIASNQTDMTKADLVDPKLPPRLIAMAKSREDLTTNEVCCLICMEPFREAERLHAYGACNHRNVCCICLMRLRAVGCELSCPVCRQKNEAVIATMAEVPFRELTLSGTSTPTLHYHEDSRIYFPPAFFVSVVTPLWEYKCQECPYKSTVAEHMQEHCLNAHNLRACLLCWKHKQVFPAEQVTYTPEQYEKHTKDGGSDGSVGHPECTFCQTRFYNKTELLKHATKDHYTCHLCHRDGGQAQFKYYRDYKMLEEHHKRDHFACDAFECIEKRNVVFRSLLELQSHKRVAHRSMSQITQPIVGQVNFEYGAALGGSTSGSSLASLVIGFDGQSKFSPADSDIHSASMLGTIGGFPSLGSMKPEMYLAANQIAESNSPTNVLSPVTVQAATNQSSSQFQFAQALNLQSQLSLAPAGSQSSVMSGGLGGAALVGGGWKDLPDPASSFPSLATQSESFTFLNRARDADDGVDELQFLQMEIQRNFLAPTKPSELDDRSPLIDVNSRSRLGVAHSFSSYLGPGLNGDMSQSSIANDDFYAGQEGLSGNLLPSRSQTFTGIKDPSPMLLRDGSLQRSSVASPIFGLGEGGTGNGAGTSNGFGQLVGALRMGSSVLNPESFDGLSSITNSSVSLVPALGIFGGSGGYPGGPSVSDRDVRVAAIPSAAHAQSSLLASLNATANKAAAAAAAAEAAAAGKSAGDLSLVIDESNNWMKNVATKPWSGSSSLSTLGSKEDSLGQGRGLGSFSSFSSFGFSPLLSAGGDMGGPSNETFSFSNDFFTQTLDQIAPAAKTDRSSTTAGVFRARDNCTADSVYDGSMTVAGGSFDDGDEGDDDVPTGSGSEERANFSPEFIKKLVDVLRHFHPEGVLGSQYPDAYKKVHGERLVLENKKGRKLKLLNVLDGHPNVRKVKAGTWKWFYQDASPSTAATTSPKFADSTSGEVGIEVDLLPAESFPSMAWLHQYGMHMYRWAGNAKEWTEYALHLPGDTSMVFESDAKGPYTSNTPKQRMLDILREQSRCDISIATEYLHGKVQKFLVFVRGDSGQPSNGAMTTALELTSALLREEIDHYCVDDADSYEAGDGAYDDDDAEEVGDEVYTALVGDGNSTRGSSVFVGSSAYARAGVSVAGVRVQRILDIPQEAVGLVAGKGGKKLHAMRKKSGAYMNLVSKTKSKGEFNKAPAKLTISGSRAAVDLAVAMTMAAFNDQPIFLARIDQNSPIAISTETSHRNNKAGPKGA